MEQREAGANVLENERRFERLYRLHYPRMVGQVSYMVNDAEQAQEIVQDVFVRLHRNLPTIASDDLVPGYLFIACRNAIKNEYRRRSRVKSGYGKSVLVDMEKTDFFFRSAETEEEAFLRKEESKIILGCLDKLRYEDREIIVMKEFGGQRYEEIAAALGTNTAVVRGRLHKARQRLRKILLENQMGAQE
jgi:RNA polymerase sigma-70 factor (ECF subfamily)